ncbi:MAG: thiamine-phosphate kinase [Bacteroidales bacterium]|nr:thiamine-phosphate kinase [Bacteroidales bacterium]
MIDTENKSRTELGELGEFTLIEHLTKDFEIKNAGTIKGVGDDAAVIDNGGKRTVVSTDMLIEGIDFDMTYTPLRHLGYKAVAINLSDIAAMNATPKQITVNIAVSNRYSVEALSELYAGIYLACQRYDVDLVGGDTSSSPAGMYISITAIGEIEPEKVVYRSGAKVHDLICVSGDLGSAYSGLLILQREKATFKANPNYQPDLASFDYVLERYLKPEPRLDIIKFLKEKDVVPTSMIDVSDGLASDMMQICKASGVGCEVYEEKIPIDYATTMVCSEFGQMLPVSNALNGGEDYELLFTIKQSDYEKIKGSNEVHIIGHITDQSMGTMMVTPQNTTIELRAQGWKEKED